MVMEGKEVKVVVDEAIIKEQKTALTDDRRL